MGQPLHRQQTIIVKYAKRVTNFEETAKAKGSNLRVSFKKTHNGERPQGQVALARHQVPRERHQEEGGCPVPHSERWCWPQGAVEEPQPMRSGSLAGEELPLPPLDAAQPRVERRVQEARH